MCSKYKSATNFNNHLHAGAILQFCLSQVSSGYITFELAKGGGGGGGERDDVLNSGLDLHKISLLHYSWRYFISRGSPHFRGHFSVHLKT